MLVRATALALPLADESVQCVVTSPPYWGLRDYGVPGQLGLEPTPGEYVERMVEVARELRRVLRPDGTLWLNLGDSYASTTGLKTSAPQQSREGRRGVLGPREMHPSASRGNLTAYKDFDGLKSKDLVGIPWRVALALQADGWYLRADIIWAKPNPMPESVTDRPTKAHEYVFLLTRSAAYFYDADAIRERVSESPAAAVWRRIWTADKDVKQTALGRSPGRRRADATLRNARTVWTLPSEPYAGAHFATMPPKLARRCILAGSRPGDRVLDPFAGSGTTVRVARELGRVGVGVDLNGTYLHEQAAVRIRCTAGLGI